MEKPMPHCPKCNSVEWFPGVACYDCGWEGSASDAYEHVRAQLGAERLRIAELEAANESLREEFARRIRRLSDAVWRAKAMLEQRGDHPETHAFVQALKALEPGDLDEEPT